MSMACCVLLLVGCRDISPAMSLEKYSETRLLMGTVIRVDVCSSGIDSNGLSEAFSAVWSRLEDIDRRMSVFNEESDIANINREPHAATAVAPETYQLLRDAVRYTQLTNGAFDVTVFPLVELWRRGGEENTVPTAQEIENARQAVGAKHIRFLDNNTVALSDERTKIDLGGIAKGYAVDEAVRILRAHGFTHFLVDAGGDIFAAGRNCSGQPWRVGIRDPRNRDRLIDAVAVSDVAVTTSGDYERYYEIEGQRYSHVINPATGYPQKGAVSATVIAPTARQADALSTALCVVGAHDGIALIESLGDARIAAIVFDLTADQELKSTASAHYDAFRCGRD